MLTTTVLHRGAHVLTSAASSAEEDLGCAARGCEHARGAAVRQEVADVLALGAPVVVALGRALLVLGAHVQRVAAGRVNVHSPLGYCSLRNKAAMSTVSSMILGGGATTGCTEPRSCLHMWVSYYAHDFLEST